MSAAAAALKLSQTSLAYATISAQQQIVRHDTLARTGKTLWNMREDKLTLPVEISIW